MYVFICIRSGEVKYNNKRSLETHVETHFNAGSELVLVIGSTRTHVNRFYVTH